MAIANVLTATASVVVRATAERCFDAWLDPKIAARFLHAGANDTATFENDPREGGAFRLTMHGPQSNYEHEGRYVLIERPRRLVFTWVSVATQERLSLVTVTFTDVAGGVRVDVLHEGLPDQESAAAHLGGWTDVLGNLGELLEQEA